MVSASRKRGWWNSLNSLGAMYPRLEENRQRRVILDKMIDVAQLLGLIRKHTNQRVDATHVVISEKTVCEKTLIAVRETPSPKQTIFDPCDLSIKLGRKGTCSWVGSKCHVVEAAEGGKVNFITDMIYQPANEYDGKVHD